MKCETLFKLSESICEFAFHPQCTKTQIYTDYFSQINQMGVSWDCIVSWGSSAQCSPVRSTTNLMLADFQMGSNHHFDLFKVIMMIPILVEIIVIVIASSVIIVIIIRIILIIMTLTRYMISMA